MIYATDYDRTLIYSIKFLEMHPCPDKVVLVDKSKIDSYISNRVLNKLRYILELGIQFIPVTARSVEEFKRVNIPGVNPEYAITTCGGVILHNGERDKDWDNHIKGNINIREIDKIRVELNELQDVNYNTKFVDEAYLFTKFDINNKDRLKVDLARLQSNFEGYSFRIDKNKLYAIPNIVSKNAALTWLASKLGETEIIASGDGENDICFLNSANLAMIPSHCTIDVSKDIKANYIVIENGVLSPLETLNIIESRLIGKNEDI